MHSGLYPILRRMIDDGAIPCSAIGRRSEVEMRPLLDSGALSRCRRGRGMVLEVHDPAAVLAFADAMFPHGNTPPVMKGGAPLPPRSEAIALHRNAKQARTTTAEPVLLRAVTDATATRGTTTVDLLAMTRATGAACLLIDDVCAWRLESVIAVVENLEVFLHFEKLDCPAPIVLYAGGRLSGRVLSWLASDAMSMCRYIHCGDYDPVGLDEYRRLRERLAGRVTLHAPASIEVLFSRYGKRTLLKDSSAVLARLRSVDVPEIRRVVELMDTTGCGLEQEALLLEGVENGAAAGRQ